MLLESLWSPFASLREVPQMFLKPCLPHRVSPFYRKFAIYQHFCLRHHSFTFFLLKQEWIWRLGRKAENYLSACLNCEKIFEKHGQPNRRLSPQTSAGFEAAAKTVCKMFNFLSRVISGREIMDRIRAPRNNDGDSFLCMCCSRLCLLWARPNFVRLTFERDIKMWLIEFWGNGHRKRWEWVRYCCQRRYHTLQIELDTKITQQEINSPKREQFYSTRLFMPASNERVDEALYEPLPSTKIYTKHCQRHNGPRV